MSWSYVFGLSWKIISGKMSIWQEDAFLSIIPRFNFILAVWSESWLRYHNFRSYFFLGILDGSIFKLTDIEEPAIWLTYTAIWLTYTAICLTWIDDWLTNWKAHLLQTYFWSWTILLGFYCLLWIIVQLCLHYFQRFEGRSAVCSVKLRFSIDIS